MTRMLWHLTILNEQVGQYFTRDSGTAMSWMYETRRYGMRIRSSTTAQGHMRWNDEGSSAILYYQDLQINVSKLFGMMHGLVNKTHNLLCTDVLFLAEPYTDLPTIPWSKLVDNTSDETPGHNFLHSNKLLLPDGSTWLMNRIWANHRESFIEQDGSTYGYNKSRVEKWLGALVRLEELLLVLVHLTAGQPARAPELLSLRFFNTSNGGLRNVLIENGLVALLTGYHKGYAASLKRKLIYRYLPTEVGELLVYYIWLVVPAKVILTFQEGQIQDGFLWSPKGDSKGRQWNPDRLKRQLERSTQSSFGVRLTIASYRQVIIAISRRFMHADYQFLKDKEGDFTKEDQDDDSDNEDQCYGTRADYALDLQAGHGTATAGQIYARGIEELANTTIDRRAQMRHVSVKYHQLAKFASSFMQRSGMPQVSGSLVKSAVTLERRQRLKDMKDADMDGLLAKMMGPDVRFRGVQEEIIKDIMSYRPRVLGIMGTGAGKSLTFMLPAFWPGSRTSIVIVPMVALRSDMKRRCDALGIGCVEWDANSPREAKIVLVTPESAVTKGFWNFLNRLQLTMSLDRIVIDECHTVLDSTDNFRPKMERLRELFTVDCQIVMLTATLPPEDEGSLMDFMGISNVTVHKHRTTTSRSNVHYSVQQWNGNLESAVQEIKDMLDEGDKCIVYAPTKRKVEKVAMLLDCRFFHADIATECKVEILDELQSGKITIVVATNALGLGVDVADIRLIAHIGSPKSLRDYAQESGRAGRDGLASRAIIFDQRAGSRSYVPTVEACLGGEQEMHQFVSTKTICRRLMLDRYLDGDTERLKCKTDNTETMCDVCGESQMQELSTSTEEDNAEMMEIDQTILSAAFEREIIREKLNTDRAKPAKDTELLLIALETWSDTCTFCMLKGKSGHKHKTTHCDEIDGSEKERCTEATMVTRRTIKYANYSGCFKCGLPQWICNQWDGSEEAGWKRNPEAACQYPQLAIEIVVYAMTLGIAHFDKRTEAKMRADKANGCRSVVEWFGKMHVMSLAPKMQTNKLTMTLLDFMRTFKW